MIEYSERITQYPKFMTRITHVLLLASLVAAFPATAADAESLLRKAMRYFEPLPEKMPGAAQETPAQIALGKKLFFDTRLSVNDQQSCATCHRLEDGAAGVDNLPTSPGATGQPGTRNTPTVLNAGWQFRQFWDGRAENLTEQAKGPILNPVEMAMPSEEAVVRKISAIEAYPPLFDAAFPDSDPALTFHNLAAAIAAFERTLRSESRFDDFLRGDTNALKDRELEGLETFLTLNCSKCHDGALIGGGLYERLEHFGSYANQDDLGRFDVTKDEADRMVFKVPSLRNVALTAPYFHDGEVQTLDEAVRLMGTLVLGRTLSEKEVAQLVAFMDALTGKQRARAGAR